MKYENENERLEDLFFSEQEFDDDDFDRPIKARGVHGAQKEGVASSYAPIRSIKNGTKKIGRLLFGTPTSFSSGNEEERKRVIKQGTYICMFFILGFLLALARLPFGTYPLGLALIGCATSYVLTSSLGMLCAISVFRLPVAHFFSLALLILIRVLGRLLLDRSERSPKDDIVDFLKHELFSESIYLRLSAVAISVFSIGLWNIIENNFRYYDLWGALLGMVFAPVAAYIFSLFFDSESKTHRGIALAVFLVSAVYSVRLIDGMGLFLALCVSQVAVLALSRTLAPIYSLTLAALLGLICNWQYAPMFLFSSAVYVCINAYTKVGESVPLTLSLATSVLWGVLIDGKQAFYTVFPAILAAAAVDSLIKALSVGAVVSDEVVSARTRQALLTNSEAEERLRSMSESFSNLASAFKRLSDRLSRPGIFEIRKECDEVLDEVCNDCQNNALCWGEDYNTTISFLNETSTYLGSNGQIDPSFVPSAMAERCANIDIIISEINKRVKELYKDSLEKEKLTVFSADYSALSRIINESIAERQAENTENKELTARALDALGQYKEDFHTISVWGKRKLRVFARLKSVNEHTLGMREFKRMMEICCDCSFANPVLKIEGKSMTVTLNMRPVFTAQAAVARQSAGNIPLCGDSPSFFNGHDNYFYALISDGMGTGANAALTSGICEVFLREMLEGGNRVETSLGMLNAVIAAKGSECSATVDIMELDLFSGRCTFLKSGAASSFILRDGNVYKLSARTMPLGILDELDTDMQRVKLRSDDMVFLVSDGAAPMDNYDNLISIIKSAQPSEAPEQICERIISNLKRYSKDDISCVAVKITKA